MTQAELDALPECGGYDYIESNGKRSPVARPNFAFWTSTEETCAIIDSYGQRWMIGWAYGKRWKRKAGL